MANRDELGFESTEDNGIYTVLLDRRIADRPGQIDAVLLALTPKLTQLGVGLEKIEIKVRPD